ncbi:MAG: ABC transporter permease [Nocardioidaceae bacterium]
MSSSALNRRNLLEAYFRLAPLTVPLYAIVLASLLGSLFILGAGGNPLVAYSALLHGALGSPDRVAATVARATPYMIASLAVVVGFKAGLFNIGAEGQLLLGALTAAWVGTWSWLAGTPPLLAVPFVLLAGVVGGMFWGGIPGILKARTGAHEVITTIMLNAIAAGLAQFLITSRNPALLIDEAGSTPHSRQVVDSVRLPTLVEGTGLHLGIFLAVALCFVTWFVLQRTTPGFEIRTVGVNRDAARYAGMRVNRTVVIVMVASGALAGIAGAAEVIGGASGYLTPGAYTNIGFDSIAIALLARGNPLAVIPAALLWGALLSGAPLMQVQADLSVNLVRIVQALIILFVAADAIVRLLFRIRAPRGVEPSDSAVFARGWGS